MEFPLYSDIGILKCTRQTNYLYLFPGDSKSGKSYEVNDHDLADVDEYLRHSIDDEDAPDYEDYFDYFNHVVESQKIVT